MAGLAGKGGAVYYGAQASTTFTNEAMTGQAADNQTFIITDAAKSMWDDTASFTVQKDTAGNGTFVTQAASTYTIDYAIGRVVFASAIGASDVVRVSGKYFTKTQVAEAHEWTLDIERQLENDNAFGDSWETFVSILGKGSGSVKLHWGSEAFATRLMAVSPRIVLSLFVDSANNKRYEFGALLTKDGVSAGVKGLIEEELAFTSTGRVYYT